MAPIGRIDVGSIATEIEADPFVLKKIAALPKLTPVEQASLSFGHGRA